MPGPWCRLLFVALFALPLRCVAADLPIETHTIRDGTGRTVTYYVNHPAQPAPILLMIQGSGCVPVMRFGATTYSSLYDFLPLAQEGNFTVVAVEKPFDGESNADTPRAA